MIISKILLILLSTGEAFIVDLRKGHAGRFELYDQHEGDDQRCVLTLVRGRPIDVANHDSPAAFTVVRFDPTGRYVFVGTSNGSILVFHSRTKTVGSAYLLALRFLILSSFLHATRLPALALCGDLRLQKEGVV